VNQDQGKDHSDRWTYGIAAALLLLVVGYFVASYRQGAPQDPHAQLARQAAARMAGVRCIGARASPEARQEIARMLALNTLAPQGKLPPWLPDSFAEPEGAISGADAWQALARACPDAPAFGTPFGFPSAEIEKELRADPAFAAAADRQWDAIERYRSTPARAP